MLPNENPRARMAFCPFGDSAVVVVQTFAYIFGYADVEFAGILRPEHIAVVRFV